MLVAFVPLVITIQSWITSLSKALNSTDISYHSFIIADSITYHVTLIVVILFLSYLVALIATYYLNRRNKEQPNLEPEQSKQNTTAYTPTPNCANCEKPAEHKTTVIEEKLNLELEQTKQRLVNLSTAYANGKLSETVFVTTSKRLEDKIASLEVMKASGDFDSFLNLLDSAEDVHYMPYSEASTHHYVTEKPSGLWYLLPLFFGLLGGVLGYVVVKDRDKGMAMGLLALGLIVSIIVTAVGLIFFLSVFR